MSGALHRAGPAVSPLEQPVAFQTSPSAASPLTLPLALPPSPHTGACPPPWWTGRRHSGAVAPGGLPPCTGLGGTGTAGQNSQSTCRHRAGVSGGWGGVPCPGTIQLPTGQRPDQGLPVEKGEPHLAQEGGPLESQERM